MLWMFGLMAYRSQNGQPLGETLVAIFPTLPSVWSHHQWSGQGVPQPAMVGYILDALRAQGQLPDSACLQMHPDLEASAARALDLQDPLRLPILLHADDPVFLASSWGELCRVVLMIERWAPTHRACFHVSEDKSIVSRLGGSGELQPVFFRPSPSSPSCPLSFGSGAHKWLGWIWTEAGGVEETLNAKVQVSSGVFASLAGLCTSGVIPLPFALKLFEGKVDACLRPGRWLFAALAPHASQVLDQLYAKWGRILLGVPPWMPAHAVFWELGWTLSGMARAVLDIAVRRARVQCWDKNDLYRRIFDTASHSNVFCWATRSLQILQEWGIADFCEGDMSLGVHH